MKDIDIQLNPQNELERALTPRESEEELAEGFAVASPSGFAVASPSGFAVASPSGFAVASPSGFAVASP
ncbi:MAG: DUF4774 domain-containing protein, partial [Myxococcota bacterium]